MHTRSTAPSQAKKSPRAKLGGYVKTDESTKHFQTFADAGIFSQVLEHLLVFPASNLTTGSGTRISRQWITFISRITGVPTIFRFNFGESSSYFQDSKVKISTKGLDQVDAY